MKQNKGRDMFFEYVKKWEQGHMATKSETQALSPSGGSAGR